MEGSLFPNGVLITQADLQRTERTKASQIMRNRTDWTSRGVLSGGAITINNTNTDRIDIAAFSGYTPRGDYVASSVGNYNVPMSDSTNGVVNVICAVYTEVNTRRLPVESGLTTAATATEMSYRIVAYTQSDFDNPAILVPSDDNLANDAKDRCLILGKVTATGSGQPLSTGGIENPTVMAASLYANPQSPTGMSGVDIIFVDSGSPTGTGTLEYQYVASNYQLRWTAPGSSVGDWVGWTIDDDKVVADANGYSLTVSMTLSQMPTTGTFPLTASVEIVDIYSQAVPRLTAEDRFHRSLRGTGIVTPTNPHGLAPDDIYGETILQLDEHQDRMHCNGIWKGSLSTSLQSSVTIGVGYDILHVNTPTNTDVYYVNGKSLSAIDTTDITFGFPDPTTHLYEVLVDDEGLLLTNLKMSYPLSRECRGTWIIDCSKNHTAGSYDLVITVSGSTTLNYSFTWGDGPSVDVTEYTADRAIRLFAKDGNNWIDLWVHCSVRDTYERNLPAIVGTHTDTVTVLASPSWDSNMLISNVSYWWNSDSLQGSLGFPPYSGSRSVIDKRSWGTLSVDNMADEALQELVYAPNNEFNYSGVLLDRDIAYDSYGNFEIETSGSSLNVYVSGGHCYCRGKRLAITFDPTLSLSTNATFLVYVDPVGTISQLNVTSGFAGDKNDAMSYLLGNGAERTDIHADEVLEASPERGVPLYFVTTNGTGVTSTINVMRNVNHVVHPWSVGKYNAAFQTMSAAFYHAKTWTTQASIELLVVGSVTIDEAITQPSNVSVRGVSGNQITVTKTSTTGVWSLSSGSVVDGISVSCAVLNNRIFKLNTDVKLLNSTFSCPDCFIFGDSALSNVENIVIRNCTFSTFAGLSGDESATLRYWKIYDNYFEPKVNIYQNSAIKLSLDRSLVSNNIFKLSGLGSNSVRAFTLSPGMHCYRTNFSDNQFIIDCEDSTSHAAYAISWSGAAVREFMFTNNRISRLYGDTSTTLVAIYMGSCNLENVKISNNIFKGLARGVQAFGANGFNIDISNNIFESIGTAPIYVSSDGDITNLRICDNQADQVVSTNSSVAGQDQVYGIYVGLLGTYDFKNISIEGNTIGTITSSISAKAATGIYVNGVSTGTTLYNLSVTDNSIGYMSHTATVAENMRGILVHLEISTVRGVTVSRNSLRSLVNNTGSADGIVLNLTGAACNYYGVNVCNNTLAYLEYAAASAYYSQGIYLGSTPTTPNYCEAFIKDNHVIVEASNGAADCYGIQSNLSAADLKISGNFINVFDGTSDATSNGIHVSVAGTSKNDTLTISGNTVLCRFGYGVYASSSIFTDISNNSIVSGKYGIFKAGDSTFKVESNNVKLAPISNDLIDGSYCIHAFSYGGSTISGNYTGTTVPVQTVDGVSISDIVTAGGGSGFVSDHVLYHIRVVIEEGSLGLGKYNNTNISNNFIDFLSQGSYYASGSYDYGSMRGLTVNINTSADDVGDCNYLHVINNTFSGCQGTGDPVALPYNAPYTDDKYPYAYYGGSFGSSSGRHILSSNMFIIYGDGKPTVLSANSGDFASNGTNMHILGDTSPHLF